MKLVRLATAATLSTLILAGGAVNAFGAETRTVITDGEVEFVQGSGEELEVTPPEEEPGVVIPPEVEGTTGPLSIVKAVHMNFGKQEISNQEKTYNMVAEMQELAATGEMVPYVSFAQVQDSRGNYPGWKLNVDMTEFTSSTGKVLSGARIIFADSYIRYAGIDQEQAPTNHTAGEALEPGRGVTVMTAEADKGAGISSVVWGNQEKLTAQFEDEKVDVVENDSIKLWVPGTTAKEATTYNSTLTWSIESTPGDGAGESI